MSDIAGSGEEVIGHMREDWMDDEAVPASWLHDPGDDSDQHGDDLRPYPAAGDEPPLPEDEPWWLTDEVCGTPDEEYAAWLASLPDDIRAGYEAGPDIGESELVPAGFTHHDGSDQPGSGFAAGGVLDQLAPGPLLARALAEATEPGYHELSDSEQIGVLCAWQRQAAWAQAGLAAAAHAVVARRQAQSTRPGWSRLADHITDEFAVALRLTTLSAGQLLGAAAGLDRLPQVAAALSAGHLDWARATLITSQLAVLTDEQATAVAAAILQRAAEQTTAQLRAALARAVLAADPAAACRRRKEGRKDTRVEVWHEASGNNVLAGRELAAADVIAADAQLTADAAWLRRRGASGTLAELRAAAFIARLSGSDMAALLPTAEPGADCRPGEAGSPHSRADRAPADPAAGTINLTMPLSAYAGLGDNPGEAAGYGTIDADTGRDLAARISATARWCLTLTGPDGRAVAHACARPGRGPQPGVPAIRWATGLRGRLQFLESGSCGHHRESPGYSWPASLRRIIETRQRTCAAPGCRRPARRCDIDHTTPYGNGGRTCECNGAPLCRRHHRCKQVPGWHLAQGQPGVMTWQLPSGRAYTTAGDLYPV
jgi:hypothetical protein